MSLRLVVTFQALPGKGAEFLQVFKARCDVVTAEEPGCIQYEAFQSAHDPDKIVLLEQWESQEALDVHLKLGATRPRISEGFAAGPPVREDYEYARFS